MLMWVLAQEIKSYFFSCSLFQYSIQVLRRIKEKSLIYWGRPIPLNIPKDPIMQGKISRVFRGQNATSFTELSLHIKSLQTHLFERLPFQNFSRLVLELEGPSLDVAVVVPFSFWGLEFPVLNSHFRIMQTSGDDNIETSFAPKFFVKPQQVAFK